MHQAKQNKRLAAGRQAPTTSCALSDGHVGRLSSIDCGTVTDCCGAASAFMPANLQPSRDRAEDEDEEEGLGRHQLGFTWEHFGPRMHSATATRAD